MAALVGSYTTEWLDLLIRWLHVIAGIVWIGTSFYFIGLDHHLRPPQDARDVEEGIGGEASEIHGGGFYRVHKFKVAPPRLPEHLHWYKWEAYTTWLSGFALFVVLYYVDARLYLIDTSVADLAPWEAIAISVALLGAAWGIYDLLCRVLGRHQLVLGACMLGLVTGTAHGLAHLFSARAVYIQTGAMLGTIMVANVFFVIIPGQRELVRAKEQGREPDPRPGIEGKRRSVHNNYLTLPVVFAMISTHFPFTYGDRHGWAVLVGLMVIGAWIRHFFNLRHQGRTAWWIPVTAAATVAGLAVAIRPEGAPSAPLGAKKVAFARVQTVISQRCAPCHSLRPTYPGFTSAPKSVLLDTPEQIAAQAGLIRSVAVSTTFMPLGNATKMAQQERDLLGRWIAQGARIK